MIRYNNITIITANVYGYNTKPENDHLLECLEKLILLWLSKYPYSFLIIGGDFNITLDNAIDRWPPGRPSSFNTSLKVFMEKFDVVDVWREKFPNDRSFTWSNRAGSRQSRIDFWLLSKSIDKDNISINILATPLTDHRAIHINIQLFVPDNTLGRSSYWKLNNSLLKFEVVKVEITKQITRFWIKTKLDKSYSSNWELFKFETGQFLRKYGSFIAKSRRAEEEEVISKITSFYQRPLDKISEEDRFNFLQLQNKLDDLYRRKAEGAFIRSRKRWLEEGEQNSAYFFRLEKYHAKNNSIHQLNINGVITDNAKLISNFCCNF